MPVKRFPFQLEKPQVAAFTLVELLVVIGIVAILAALTIPVVNTCIEKAHLTREISGARTAITAWQIYAAENNGTLIPGYLSFSQANSTTVQNGKGQTVSYPINARYVFRLAPYLNYGIKGSLLVNKQARLTDDYNISMEPSLGLNMTFVGGDYGSGTDLEPSEANFKTYGKFVVTNINEIHYPSKMLVFASARFTDASQGNAEGYNAIKSPFLNSSRWQETYDESRPYYDYGCIHPRFNGSAVCAMADGHVELLSLDQLRDMRRWSNQAAEANDPNWTLKSL